MLDYYDKNADFSDRTLAIIIQIRIFERKVKTEKKNNEALGSPICYNQIIIILDTTIVVPKSSFKDNNKEGRNIIAAWMYCSMCHENQIDRQGFGIVQS